MCFHREGLSQVANNLIIMPLKTEVVNNYSNDKVNSNFLFKVISIFVVFIAVEINDH